MDNTDKIIIQNEKQAWNLFREVLDNKIPEGAQVRFEGWPVFKITIEGKDFDGSIPTRIMPPLLDLQKEIYRLYCQTKYNTENIMRLSNDERELLELIVKVGDGSSEYISKLGKIFNEIVDKTNMSANQAIILLLGVGVIATSGLSWYVYVQSQERQHALDTTVKLSQEETKRHEILVKALTKSPELKKRNEALSDVKGNISRKLKTNDQLKIGDEVVIDGARAAEIVPPPKQESYEDRIDGVFIINEIKFPRLYGEDYRLHLTNTSKKQSFWANASPKVLDKEQIAILKDGGFGIRKVEMQINVRVKNDVVSRANIVSIQWPE